MINSNIVKDKIKIVIVLIVTFAFVRMATPQVFLSNTPKINGKTIAKIRTLPQIVKSSVLYYSQKVLAMISPSKSYSSTDSKNNQNIMAETVKKLPVASMLPVSKGVYASQDSSSKVVYIHLTKDAENSPYTERTVTINGEQVTFRFPK